MADLGLIIRGLQLSKTFTRGKGKQSILLQVRLETDRQGASTCHMSAVMTTRLFYGNTIKVRFSE